MQGRKRQWVAPEVRKYGDFESTTQQCTKVYGASDGFTFMADPISCAS